MNKASARAFRTPACCAYTLRPPSGPPHTWPGHGVDHQRGGGATLGLPWPLGPTGGTTSAQRHGTAATGPGPPRPGPALVRTVSPRLEVGFRGSESRPPMVNMPRPEIFSEFQSGKIDPSDGTQAQKFSYEKFFWDLLHDGGHSDKVANP